MTIPDPSVTRYLDQLAAALPGSRRRRERILAEVEDHLCAQVEESVEAGTPTPEAANAALASFGAPRAVAASFAQTAAKLAVERGGRWALGTVAAFAALAVGLALASASTPLDGGASSAAAFFALQIALVAAGIGVLRDRRARAAGRADAATLRLVVRAGGVGVGAVAVAVGADGLALAGAADAPRALVALVGLVALAALVAVARLALAAARVRRLARLADAPAEAASALEEAAGLVGAARRRVEDHATTRPGPVLASVARCAALTERATRWAASRRAGAALAVAVIPGALLAAASLREHGVPGDLSALGRELAAAAVLFAVEAGAVVLCAYAFDRLLGLWPERLGHDGSG